MTQVPFPPLNLYPTDGDGGAFPVKTKNVNMKKEQKIYKKLKRGRLESPQRQHGQLFSLLARMTNIVDQDRKKHLHIIVSPGRRLFLQVTFSACKRVRKENIRVTRI